jgi:tetratricopeptide (TPR) repeat protein
MGMTAMVRQMLGLALLATAALVSGCSAMPGGMRPVMTVDGQRMDFDDPMERGRGLVASGQYGLAIDELSKVVHDDPRNVRALNLLAVTYAHLKRFDLADRYHEQALQIDPNSVAALNNLGYSYLVRGNTARAIGLLERAAALKGGNPVVTANLALATGQTESVAARQAQPAPQVEQDIKISEHVTLMRRTGQLQRIAPGVQLLVTTAPLKAPGPQLVAANSGVSEELSDPRYRLFRKLFSLFESAQVAEGTARPVSSSFLHFSDVDDFSAL